jgi:hypothetical protein
MSLSVSVQVRSPQLALLVAQLSGEKKVELNRAMAISVRELTRRHLTKLSGERHATANKLGASPSGHLGQAVRAVEAAEITAEDGGASFVINHPGLGRAFHDVTIAPKNAKALTIPVAAIAYNRRAGQFNNLYVWKSKTTGNAFLAMRDPGADKHARPILVYLLVRSVTQKQDRTLLPSQEEWESAAAQGALDFIRMETGSN